MSIDLLEFSLCKGDIVTLVDELHAADGSVGYAVEICTPSVMSSMFVSLRQPSVVRSAIQAFGVIPA
ncbi:MAG TPA: hypothetical protein VF585_03875 [Chthoniobacterales bacterium]